MKFLIVVFSVIWMSLLMYNYAQAADKIKITISECTHELGWTSIKSVCYWGVISDHTFVLGYSNCPIYYPLLSKTIVLLGSRYQLLDINPEYIELKYLGKVK